MTPLRAYGDAGVRSVLVDADTDVLHANRALYPGACVPQRCRYVFGVILMSSQFVKRNPPAVVEIQHRRHAGYADIAKNSMGSFMHTFFFNRSFFGRGIEALQKFAESNDVYEFMGYDVNAER